MISGLFLRVNKLSTHSHPIPSRLNRQMSHPLVEISMFGALGATLQTISLRTLKPVHLFSVTYLYPTISVFLLCHSLRAWFCPTTASTLFYSALLHPLLLSSSLPHHGLFTCPHSFRKIRQTDAKVLVWFVLFSAVAHFLIFHVSCCLFVFPICCWFLSCEINLYFVKYIITWHCNDCSVILVR